MPSVGDDDGVVLARQQAAGDRVVRDHPESLLRAQREELALNLAEQQVVAGLHRVEAHQAARLAPAERPRHLVGQEVGAADVADLAGVDEVVEGAQRLVDRRRRVGRVQLIEVDVVGAESPQRGLHGGQDVLARAAPLPRGGPGGADALGRQHELVPLAA